MLDLTMVAFDLAFEYRNPVIIVGDGYLGQMTGRVNLPDQIVEPGLPDWAVYGDAAHRGNLISSIHLNEPDLEAHNVHINEKYDRMIANEQRSDCFYCDDAEFVVVACNTPARMAKGAVQALRSQGIKAGLFRPITLWPFPVNALRPVLERAKALVVVEAGPGQLEDEIRLALSHAGATLGCPIEQVRRYGGVLPQQEEIVNKITALVEAAHV
jgi:pyruvate/2-oxoacid:ferredoxin oxidoreductase alpha subunit